MATLSDFRGLVLSLVSLDDWPYGLEDSKDLQVNANPKRPIKKVVNILDLDLLLRNASDEVRVDEMQLFQKRMCPSAR